jgi:hypothetical protein
LLVRALSCVWLVGPRICGRVGGTRDVPVEALFPEGRERFELASSSGWSRVLGIDAVGGPPYCNVADKGGARVASRCSPYWGAANLVGMILDLVSEVGDQLGSLCQVGPPARMATERWWNAREPRQRTWVDRRQLWEAPVKDRGHVAGSAEVSSGGRCQQVAEWVLLGFGREVEQVCPQGRPGGFGGESGEVLVGLVELCDNLGSEELFGCDVGGRRCSAGPPGQAGPLGW